MYEGDIVLLSNVDRQARNARSLTATKKTLGRLFITAASCRKYAVELQYNRRTQTHGRRPSKYIGL